MTTYTIELREDEGGGYVARIPDLRGCIAQGDTPDEAVASLKIAQDLWIGVAVEDGQEVPLPSEWH